jgi:hypothetical protein
MSLGERAGGSTMRQWKRKILRVDKSVEWL